MLIYSNYTGGSQDRLEMRRRRVLQQELSDYRFYGSEGGDVQIPGLVAGVITNEMPNANTGNPEEGIFGVKWGAVTTSVVAGVSVWIATRILDHMFGKKD